MTDRVVSNRTAALARAAALARSAASTRASATGTPASTPAAASSRTANLSRDALPSLPAHVPPWPGEQLGGVFVRRGPVSGGEPALFVHGLGGSSRNWTDLIALLADRVDAEALDLPGFGQSPPPAEGYRLSTHVRAVARRIEERAAGPVHLFGNSLGGAVGTLLAARRPHLVRTLTLISPALPDLRPRRGGDPQLPLLLLPGLDGLARRQLARTTPEQRAQAVVRLCFADPSRISAGRLAEMVEEVRRRGRLPHDRDALAGSLRGLVGSYLVRGPRAIWRQASRVRAPTLLVWGSQDRLVDVSLAPRAARTFPDARLLVLDGVGHVAQMERPDLVARAFLGMLAELPGTRRPRPARGGR